MTMIAVRGLTKRYGPDTVVDDLSSTVEAGRVTGFPGTERRGQVHHHAGDLGPASLTGGSVAVGGRRYRDLPVPLTEVGALPDAGAVHGGRKARGHLPALAVGNGLPRRRVDEVPARTGLDGVAGKRAGGFSLGTRQRLASRRRCSATRALIFDEPTWSATPPPTPRPAAGCASGWARGTAAPCWTWPTRAPG
ncbi:hypothetical protein FHX81_1027 [Saccharothrix saharensis]|uniref:ABC transporter family protein n=1 Tax=Saccharothrix saharensis TaxID=571190 RepID=A0A543J7E0_9PSEU|nr:hypothetical protein FHX81_1027 [Saccharothrix saharensis]